MSDKPAIYEQLLDLTDLTGSRHITGGLFNRVLLSQISLAFQELDAPGVLLLDCQKATGYLDKTAFSPAVIILEDARKRSSAKKTIVFINTVDVHRKYLEKAVETAPQILDVYSLSAPSRLLILAHASSPAKKWFLINQTSLNPLQTAIWETVNHHDALTIQELSALCGIEMAATLSELEPLTANFLVDVIELEGEKVVYPLTKLLENVK